MQKMKPTIYFRFEKFNVWGSLNSPMDLRNINRDRIGNFVSKDQKGFRFSQVVEFILNYYCNDPNSNDTIAFESIKSKEQHGYIIPVAVCYHPNDWTDMTNGVVDNRPSIFEMLNPKYLKDLQDGKAMFLIDQSVEGYSTTWLWPWFHEKCKKYNINPECILYLTGDQSCEETYNTWCNSNNITKRIRPIPSVSLSTYIKNHYTNVGINSNFDEIFEYKKNNDLFLYDCTNMRPRPQRVLNYMHLLNADLLSKGNISMAAPKIWYADITASDYLRKYKLPADIYKQIDANGNATKAKFSDTVSDESHYYVYVERILKDVYKNSWLSIITESSFFEYEHSVFVSEKTFKPIACMQPFVIVGSKHTLKYLRKLGYKTFSPFIDESYDDLDDADRIPAIMEELKRIDQIEDKSAWYNDMRDILEHNFNLFMEINKTKPIEQEAIAKYYFDYFKEYNVQKAL